LQGFFVYIFDYQTIKAIRVISVQIYIQNIIYLYRKIELISTSINNFINTNIEYDDYLSESNSKIEF